jgi:hypothetical protein
MPKLSLAKFDGSATKWAGWRSLYKGMVGAQNLSRAEKIAHLQGSIIEMTRTATKGYGYNETFPEQAV